MLTHDIFMQTNEEVNPDIAMALAYAKESSIDNKPPAFEDYQKIKEDVNSLKHPWSSYDRT